MAKIYAYRQKLLSGGFELEEKKERCFVEAYRKGYSVVEIASACSMKSAKYLHASLVKLKVIPGGRRGRQSKKIELPDKLSKLLKKHGLTFAQWCAGWGFTPEGAADGLADRRSEVWQAVKNDFPSYYQEVTGINVNSSESGGARESFDVDLKLTWSGLKKNYVAQIAALGVETVGKTPHEAVYQALAQRKLLEEIAILEKLPPKPKNK